MSAKRNRAERLSVRDALDIVDEDLPDGAWMAVLEEMTGLDAGDIAAELQRIAKEESRGKRS